MNVDRTRLSAKLKTDNRLIVVRATAQCAAERESADFVPLLTNAEQEQTCRSGHAPIREFGRLYESGPSCVIMPQENKKSSNGVGSSTISVKERQDNAAKDPKDREIQGKRKANVKKKENLELCKDTDNMPELKDEPKLLEDEQINLDLSELPPEVMEYARREVGETDEVKCQMLQEFRDLIYERGECLPHRMDDDFLIRFLRARNYNLKSAYRLIVNYYNFKEEYPEIHQQMDVMQMKVIGDDNVIAVPPYRTPCGRRMLIYRIGNWDPRKYPVEELFKATVSVLELAILEPRAQILGGNVIFDLKNLSTAHVWIVTPQIASMIVSLMVTAFPIKTHAIHIVNQSWVFDAIFAVFKPLLDSKMRNRIFFHGSNYESLHKHLPPEYLPKDYGGVRNDQPYYKWIESICQDPKIIEQMKKMGYILTDEMLKSFNLK